MMVKSYLMKKHSTYLIIATIVIKGTEEVSDLINLNLRVEDQLVDVYQLRALVIWVLLEHMHGQIQKKK